MFEPLPARPNLQWLRKTAKQKLKSLRTQNPGMKLAEAQLMLAREYGFESWRKLRAHVEENERAAPAPQLSHGQIVGALLKLVGTGRIDDVRRILSAAPQLANAIGPHPFWGGRPQPLHVAIETKRRDLFDLLLEHGADVNGTNDQYDHWSPLMLTVNQDRPDMREELLRRGAKIGLLEALLFGDDQKVEEILRRKSALPTYAPNAGSILNFARTTFAIDRLLELGAPIDMKDRWGSTPIESMSRMGPRGRHLVKHMIERGVPAAPEEHARLGDQSKLAAMIETDPFIANSDAVMMGAVDFGHHDLVKWLVDRGGNVNARSSAQSRHTALHSAAWNGDLPMVKLLLDAGADTTLLDDQHHGTAQKWAEVAVDVENNPKCREVADYLRTR